MAESAAFLVDDVLPQQYMRRWVLSFPYQLLLLFSAVRIIARMEDPVLIQKILDHLGIKPESMNPIHYLRVWHCRLCLNNVPIPWFDA